MASDIVTSGDAITAWPTIDTLASRVNSLIISNFDTDRVPPLSRAETMTGYQAVYRFCTDKTGLTATAAFNYHAYVCEFYLLQHLVHLLFSEQILDMWHRFFQLSHIFYHELFDFHSL